MSTRRDDDVDSTRFDAVVLGGGSAGLAFAKRAAGNGARIALVEMDELGGTCVNRGCVPKKLLWHVAHTRRKEDMLVDSGHMLSMPRMDLGHVQDRIATHIEGIRDTYREALDEAGVALVRGRAWVADRGTVEVERDDGPQRIACERIVIATGSEPMRADVPGGELAEVSNDVFSWREVPERILIVGGGYIGIEFATIFSGFGSAVTLVDEGEEILEEFDSEAIGFVRERLNTGGVEFVMRTKLARIDRSQEDGGADGLLATLENGRTVPCDRILVAMGRDPRLAGLGEIVDGLERARNGSLDVSDSFETSEPGLYAIGDAADRMPLTPVAKRDGEWLADRLFGDDPGARLDLGLVATVTYADPPIAQVGRVGDKAEGLAVERGEVSPLESGLSDGRLSETFFFKLLTEGEDGPLRGACLVSRTAANEISWAAAAVAAGLPKRSFSVPAAIHPSFTEEFIG